MSETARRFFIVSSSYEMDGPFQPMDRRDVPNIRDGSIADRGVIAASKVPNRFAWNNGDKKFAWNNATEKMPPGNRTAF
jgi:hypothetical protein